MRKVLFMFLLLLALPTVAQELELTETPYVTYASDNRYLYVTVFGEGTLTVDVTVDGVLVDHCECPSPYEYMFEFDHSEHEMVVTATAQEEGKAVSEAVYEVIPVHVGLILPPPIITYEEDNEGIDITMSAAVQLRIAIYINGEQMADYPHTPSSPFTYRVERSYDEEKYIVITAIDCTPDGITSETTTFEYYLERKVRPITETPIVTFVEDDEGVNIVAEGEGQVYLFVNSEEVENPCYIARSDEDQILYVTAYAIMPDYDPSDVYEATIVLTAKAVEPPVLEQTCPPTMSYEIPDGSYVIVQIHPSEPSVVYYCIGHDVGIDENGWTLWMYDEMQMYDGPVMINEQGHYRVMAYAIADGKEQSMPVAIEFTLSQPVPPEPYDFEEDGIFYKIIGEDEVSVCAEAFGLSTYSGEVVIPATVTHYGVTYRVTKIADNAFKECTGLTRVTIGALVTEIGANAFDGCSSLTTLTLPDYVITVGSEAFANCTSLTSLTLGFGLSNIGDNAFSGCSALATVTCKAATPPTMGNPYSFDCYDRATLRVHPAVINNYRNTDYWNRFQHIVDEYNVAPMAGDADGDGRLSARDVATLINMLLNAK